MAFEKDIKICKFMRYLLYINYVETRLRDMKLITVARNLMFCCTMFMGCDKERLFHGLRE